MVTEETSERMAPGETPDADGVAGMSPEMRRFVEQYAVVIAGEGLPRMAGRIFAYLQICEPPERTAAQLARDLGASVGSISTMTRLLLSAELIERVSRPGERADRFRISPEGVAALMRGSVARIRRFSRMTSRGLDLLADGPPAAGERLRAFNDLYVFFEEKLPALVDEWERDRKDNR